ncbi:MAG: hypothetical protein VW683_00250 [Betaproteobacteria bacterium]|jgi:hypothetical protein
MTDDIKRTDMSVVFECVDCMKGLDFGIRFFDQENKIYLSPETYERMESGENFKAQYFVSSFRKSEKTIEEVVVLLNEEIEKLSTKKLVIKPEPIRLDGKYIINPL